MRHRSRPGLAAGTIIGYRADGRPIHLAAGGAPVRFEDIPTDSDARAEYLAGLSVDQLLEAEQVLVAEADRILGEDDGANVDADGLATLTAINESVTAVREVRAAAEADAAEQAESVARLRDQIRGGTGSDTDDSDNDDADDGNDDGGDGSAGQGEAEMSPQLEAIAASFATSMANAFSTMNLTAPAVTAPVPQGRPGLNRHLRRSLGAVAAHAPDAGVPTGQTDATILAAASIPGFTAGAKIDGVNALVKALGDRAKRLPISKGNGEYVPVASMTRDFRHTLAIDSSPEDVDEVLRQVLDTEALVAAGGWCAPSEIRYDFFNIVAEDGLLDLPSVGVLNRGGIRWPVSPSFNDIVSASPNGLWTWTEADDISALDGTPTKPCVRIPCPDFDEMRLDCDGLCVTNGNLTDYAYPELVANFLRLIFAARAHLTNARIIGLLVGESDAVTAGGSSDGFINALFSAVDVQAWDYRTRFAMADDAILETVFPSWVLGALRSDWIRRTGIEDVNLATGAIIDMFDLRSVRAQFVQDWQVRGAGLPGNPLAPITDWPDEVDFLLYAPGTFVRGSGLSLDLGVVRDSTLNATNDHTAAWMEDCYLVAKLGHESRLVTVDLCASGQTGAADITCVPAG